MDRVNEIHANFKKFVTETYTSELKKSPNPDINTFLNKPLVVMLQDIKMFLSHGCTKDALENLIMGNLGINKSELKPETLAKLRRYGDYFYEIAQI